MVFIGKRTRHCEIPPAIWEPVFRLSKAPSPEEEADRFDQIYGGCEAGMPAILKVLQDQFSVIQARTQMLLTIGTITLTITGFSGYRIKEAGFLAQSTMTLGLAIVVATMLMILVVAFRVRWVSQFSASSSRDHVIQVIQYRNWRTRMYIIELGLLMIGLALYSGSLILYVMH